MKNARDDPLYIIRVQVQATGASRGGFFDVLFFLGLSNYFFFDLPQLITMKSPLRRAPMVHWITTCNGGGTKPQTIWEEGGETAAQQEEEEGEDGEKKKENGWEMWKREKNDRDNRIVIPISFQLQWPAQARRRRRSKASQAFGLICITIEHAGRVVL